MGLNKRDFIKSAILAMAAGGLSGVPKRRVHAAESDAFSNLPNLAENAVPITVAERRKRIEKAQSLMREAGLSALVLEPGSSLVYFTGLSLWRSERFHGAVIPASGEIAYVSPAFEEPALREKLQLGDDVRVWEEHEDPFRLVAQILADRGVKKGAVGMEASVRHFVVDGIAKQVPHLSIASAQAVVTGCRAIKSPAEIALMQIATDITIAAYRHTVPRLEAGMQPADFRAMMDGATRALGGRPVFSMALFGPASAFPHGSNAPQILKEGDTVLMDCGCAVEGYQSDISRTVVYGTPSARQREVWAIERAAQMAVFEAAQPGAHCGDVDKAARALLESHGFGPGYQVPGLPHRTGHGIGMDGHESPNFVKDEATRIAPGMCFSNEPGIYIYGGFGVRLEDCLWIAEDGPRWFSTPSASLDDPLGLG